eukprot:COSAG06_NODE_556_length_14336_cov_8.683290_3_plen_85_part_00
MPHVQEPPVADLRIQMYETWKACYDAVRAELPELGVGVMDAGQGVWPNLDGKFGLTDELLTWLRTGDHLFYAFHHYGALLLLLS